MSQENPTYNDFGDTSADDSLRRLNEVSDKVWEEVSQPGPDGLRIEREKMKEYAELTGKISGLKKSLEKLDKEKHADFLAKFKMEFIPLATALSGSALFAITGNGSILSELGLLMGSLGAAGMAGGTAYLVATAERRRNAAEENAKWTEIEEKELEDALMQLEQLINRTRNEVTNMLIADGAVMEEVTGPDGETHEELRVTEEQIADARAEMDRALNKKEEES